jgi:drug/metabolite transporter (DMT)-like permease
LIAVSLGLFAALCWSIHDLIARRYAPATGPFRMAIWVMLIGAAFLLVPVIYRGAIWNGSSRDIAYAAGLGVSYAFAVGGLLKAFSLAPVSIVGPFTAPYPALVVLWGLYHGLQPGWLEWTAIVLIIAGAVIVARFGHEEGGINVIAPGKLPVVFFACTVACLGFSASIVLGQTAGVALGSFETTFISRFPAALLLIPFAIRDARENPPMPTGAVIGIAAMALLDVFAVSGINYSGHFENKEYGAMAITAYGALAVLLATLILKEKVSAGQWAGILMIAAGVAYLGYAGA